MYRRFMQRSETKENISFFGSPSLPDADPERAVIVQPYGRHVLEHREHLHLPQLPDVQVGDPELRVLVPGQLRLAGRVVRNPDSRIVPVHVQEHVQRYLLKYRVTPSLSRCRFRGFIDHRG